MLPDDNGNLKYRNNKDKEYELIVKDKLNITIEEISDGNEPPYHHNFGIGKRKRYRLSITKITN